MHTVLLAVVLLCMASAASAQLHVLRTVYLHPSYDTTGTGFLASSAFIGELQRGFGSLGGDQAWNIKIGGVVELYRGDVSLLFTAASELTANPYNDIAFNPRTATWEEQLFLAGATWQAGVFHRCKHEIDNTDPPNADTPTIGYRPTKRVLILSGLAASWSMPVAVAGMDLFPALRAEWYAVHNDYRTPRNSEGRSWEHLWGSVSAALRLSIPLGGAATPYLRLWGAGLLFGGEENVGAGVEWNVRAETGVAVAGRAARVELFCAWERLFDEPALVVPQPTRVVFLGARFAPLLP